MGVSLMLVSEETPEITSARLRWEAAWHACAKLKAKHQPNYAPLELWTPLEAECKATATEWARLRSDWRRQQLSRVCQPIKIPLS